MDNIFIERLWRSLKYEAMVARRLIGEWVPLLHAIGIHPTRSRLEGAPA